MEYDGEGENSSLSPLKLSHGTAGHARATDAEKRQQGISLQASG